MDKLSSLAKRLDTIAKALYWVLLIGGILIFVALGAAAVYAWLNPQQIEIDRTLTLGFVEVELADSYLPQVGSALAEYLLAMALFGACLPVSLFFIKCSRNILGPLIRQTPFDGAVGANLKRLGWLVVAIGVLDNIHAFISMMLVRRYDLADLLLGDKITGVTFHHTYTLSFVVIAAVLFLLAYVFHYGAELQRLSDETL